MKRPTTTTATKIHRDKNFLADSSNKYAYIDDDMPKTDGHRLSSLARCEFYGTHAMKCKCCDDSESSEWLVMRTWLVMASETWNAIGSDYQISMLQPDTLWLPHYI